MRVVHELSPTAARHRAVVVRILRKMVITKRVSVTQHYINFRPSVQAWMACCCTFPAILLPMVQKLSQKPRICSKWSPWSAGCGSWSCGLSGRINEVPEWRFALTADYSSSSPAKKNGKRYRGCHHKTYPQRRIAQESQRSINRNGCEYA